MGHVDPITRTTRPSSSAHDGKLAAIAMARKLARRCYHTLRNLDPDVVYAIPKDAIPKN
ncbi:MAG: hypothetical protein LC799_09905 [Actinobacteria bacterium]|nr:hypothetical protein [Actinomycetota bacterium]